MELNFGEMAFRILQQLPRALPKGVRHKQHFDYLLVLDFEATCIKDSLLEPQEIIEFPCIAVSTKDWEIKNVFHQYVRPKIHPQLSNFCIDLTGILQEMVDDEPEFPEVFSRFLKWTEEAGYFENNVKSAFVTCGDWDLQILLPKQCEIDNLPVPDFFRQWINLKNTYSQATFYYPRTMVDMLMRLELPMIGRLHSGIQDVKNMVRIIQALQERHNFIFKINSQYKRRHDATRDNLSLSGTSKVTDS